MCGSTKRRPSPSALIVSTNQRLPDRWRVKTMKRFGSSVTLHRAGASLSARTAFDGPAPRALVPRATRATSDWRVIVARNARLSSTQTRPERPDDTHLPKKHNCQYYFTAPGRAGTSNRSGDTVQLMSHEQALKRIKPRRRRNSPKKVSVKPDFPGSAGQACGPDNSSREGCLQPRGRWREEGSLGSTRRR